MAILEPARAIGDLDAVDAQKTGLGFPAPNGASATICAATGPVSCRKSSASSMRSRGRRSSGPSRSSAKALTRVAKLADPVARHRRPAATLWPPNLA